MGGRYPPGAEGEIYGGFQMGLAEGIGFGLHRQDCMVSKPVLSPSAGRKVLAWGLRSLRAVYLGCGTSRPPLPYCFDRPVAAFCRLVDCGSWASGTAPPCGGCLPAAGLRVIFSALRFDDGMTVFSSTRAVPCNNPETSGRDMEAAANQRVGQFWAYLPAPITETLSS